MTHIIAHFVAQAQQRLCARYAALPRSWPFHGRRLVRFGGRLRTITDVQLQCYRRSLAAEHSEGGEA